MRTTNFARVATSTPLDKTAGAVTGSPKHGYTPDKKIASARYDTAPQTFAYPGPPDHDLSGRQLGRFTVVGYLRTQRSGAKWLVRCACSAYEERTSRAIKNPKNDADCCQQCVHLLYLKRTSYFDRTGKHLPLSEFI